MAQGLQLAGLAGAVGRCAVLDNTGHTSVACVNSNINYRSQFGSQETIEVEAVTVLSCIVNFGSGHGNSLISTVDVGVVDAEGQLADVAGVAGCVDDVLNGDLGIQNQGLTNPSDVGAGNFADGGVDSDVPRYAVLADGLPL